MRNGLRILTMVLLACLCSEIVHAQITGLEVDELRDELLIFGNFKSTPEAVFCDSIPLTITATSDSLIRATIPWVGRGKCGPVWVVVNGQRTNHRSLMMWQYHHYSTFKHPYSDGGGEFAGSFDTVRIRFDRFWKSRSNQEFKVLPMRTSYFVKYAFGYDGAIYRYEGPSYDSTGLPDSQVVRLNGDWTIIDPTALRELKVSATYDILSYEQNNPSFGCETIGTCNRGGPIGPTLFPPQSLSVNTAAPRTVSLSVQSISDNMVVIQSDREIGGKIYSIYGGLVRSIQIPAGSTLISTAGLSRGLYHVMPDGSPQAALPIMVF